MIEIKHVYQNWDWRCIPEDSEGLPNMINAVGTVKLLVMWKQGLNAAPPNRLWTWHKIQRLELK